MSATATAPEPTTPAPDTPAVPTVKSPEHYRKVLSKSMAEKRHELRREEAAFSKLTDQRKEQERKVARLVAECDEIASDLEDLENGRYTPPELRPQETDDDPDDSVAGAGLEAAAKAMHKRQGGGVPFDAGAQAPIEALIEFNLTAKQVEYIVDSELASKVGGITTVGHLEKAIRENEWASRMVKRIGESKWDKVIDALVAFRGKHPVPQPDDPPEATTAGTAAPAAANDELPIPAVEEDTHTIDAGGKGGGVAVICGKAKDPQEGATYVAEARWSFDPKKAELRLARAGQGDTREVAVREAVRQVLTITRENQNAPKSWVADLEKWLETNPKAPAKAKAAK